MKKIEKKNNNEWWDIRGKYKILHKINSLRTNFIIDNYDKTIEKKTILDIGCGGGLISEEFAKRKAFVTGIDENSFNIRQAKEHAINNSLKINYINNSLNSFLKKNTKKFDLILCLEVLEHVDNIENTLDKISKLMSNNSILILSTINRNVKSLIFAKIFGEYVLNWIPIGTHQFEKFIKPKEISDLLTKKNLKLKETIGMKFNPIQNKWFLSKDININYFMVFSK